MSLLDDDLGEFFDTDDFAEVMWWLGREIVVQFSDETIRISNETDVTHILSDPKVYARDTTIDGMKRGDQVSLRGTQYTVAEMLSNGVGVTELELVRA